MTSTLPFTRRLVAAVSAGFCLLGISAQAATPQTDLIFDVLGPMVCEMPPPSFDISQFRTLAETTPDAPIARGEIGGALSTSFAGGGLYGADAQGGFVVGVQGMLFDGAPELTMLCMILVRLGDTTETAGPVVGEKGLDAAPEGAFLGVFKLVRRAADGQPATFATGTVTGGTARFDRAGEKLTGGVITVEGSYAPADKAESLPFSATIAIPGADNVIRPALRLNRD